MARPIEATPVLKGKDARTLLESVRLTEPVSAERLAWLKEAAAQSKAAEKDK